MPSTLEITSPEEFRAQVEREFSSRYRVDLRPSYERGVEAVLWIDVPEQERDAVQARAANLCASFHDRTRKLIVPIVVSSESEISET